LLKNVKYNTRPSTFYIHAQGFNPRCLWTLREWSCYLVSQINPSRCTILFNIFIYFSSLHVSGIHVPIIRRKLLYLCGAGICHAVCVASGLQTRRHTYILTNTSVAWLQQFSPVDGHMDAW